YFLLLWYRNHRTLYSYVSAAFLAFAILQKIPIAFFGLAVIFMYLKKEQTKALKNPGFYCYGFIALLPSIIYFAYMSFKSEAGFVSGIANEHIFSEELLGIFSLESLLFHMKILKEYFGVMILIFALGGLIIVFLVRTLRAEILPWTISIFLEVLIICSIIEFDYYYIFLAPVLAILGGILIKSILNTRIKLIFIFILSGILVYTSIGVIEEKLVVD